MQSLYSFIYLLRYPLYLSLLMCCSCNHQKEPKMDFDRFGNLSKKTEYANFSNESTVSEYHSNGKLKSLQHFKKGKLHGSSQQYYDSGILKQSNTYDDGQLHGIDSSFNETGELISSTEYDHGKKSGKSYKYYPDGRIKFEAVYKDDVLVSVNGVVIPDQK